MQHLAGGTAIDIARAVAELVDAALGGDGRQRHHFPLVLGQHMADEVVLVQALHDDENRAGAFVVEAGVERVVVELQTRRRWWWSRRRSLDRIVDDDEIAPRPSSDPARPRPGDSRCWAVMSSARARSRQGDAGKDSRYQELCITMRVSVLSLRQSCRHS